MKSFFRNCHGKSRFAPILAVWLLVMLPYPLPADTSKEKVRGGRTIISPLPWSPPKAEESSRKVIYGDDDRLDLYQVSDPQRFELASSVCGLLIPWAAPASRTGRSPTRSRPSPGPPSTPGSSSGATSSASTTSTPRAPLAPSASPDLCSGESGRAPGGPPR